MCYWATLPQSRQPLLLQSTAYWYALLHLLEVSSSWTTSSLLCSSDHSSSTWSLSAHCLDIPGFCHPLVDALLCILSDRQHCAIDTSPWWPSVLLSVHSSRLCCFFPGPSVTGCTSCFFGMSRCYWSQPGPLDCTSSGSSPTCLVSIQPNTAAPIFALSKVTLISFIWSLAMSTGDYISSQGVLRPILPFVTHSISCMSPKSRVGCHWSVPLLSLVLLFGSAPSSMNMAVYTCTCVPCILCPWIICSVVTPPPGLVRCVFLRLVFSTQPTSCPGLYPARIYRADLNDDSTPYDFHVNLMWWINQS